MPRNSGTGFYSLPPNLAAISGDIIKSANWNTLLSDQVTTFNQPWPVSLGGTGVSSLGALLTAIGAVPLAGGAMTGLLTLSGNATAALHAVPKQQMDVALALKADASHSHSSINITDFASAVSSTIATTSINALSDVVSSAPSTGQLVVWDGSTYRNSRIIPTEYDKGVLAANTTYTQAHGYGDYPGLFEVYLQCNSAEFGYSVGDRISAEFAVAGGSNGSVRAVTTSECLYITRSAFSIDTLDKSTRAVAALTLSRWNVIFVVR